jgi:hypothetical protein
MHVGPCGASTGAFTAPPRNVAACLRVTRLQGVKSLRGFSVCCSSSLAYPGAGVAEPASFL